MVKLLNRSNPNLSNPWTEKTTLLYEITGVSHEAALEQLQIVTKIAKSNGGHDIYKATTSTEAASIWKLRKECLWSVMSQYPDRDPMITDVCVPGLF
jgi:hypothetical protein